MNQPVVYTVSCLKVDNCFMSSDAGFYQVTTADAIIRLNVAKCAIHRFCFHSSFQLFGGHLMMWYVVSGSC